MAALNSRPGSFASTKWVLNHRLNMDSKKVSFRAKTAKTTCFLTKNLNISGHLEALNSGQGSFSSTKLYAWLEICYDHIYCRNAKTTYFGRWNTFFSGTLAALNSREVPFDSTKWALNYRPSFDAALNGGGANYMHLKNSTGNFFEK